MVFNKEKMSQELQEDLEILAELLVSFAGTTIAVTGATGLIGSLILKAIVKYNDSHQSEDAIHGIGFARNPAKVLSIFTKTTGLQFIFQDICSPIQNFQCDYVIHTANSTNSRMFITEPVEVIESIYSGTKTVLEYAKQNRVRGMVYLSSMEVFGQVENYNRLSEDELGYLNIQNVRSCYPEGKRLAECLCKSYAEEYGVPVKVARLAQTFGAGVLPSDNRVFAQFARSIKKGENIVLHTRGTSVGNYVYTRDAIKAIFILLQKGEIGSVYTVVNESTTMTIKEMGELVAKELSSGKSSVIVDIPDDNRYGYASETKMRLSSEKLRKIGWAPEVGLLDMYRRMMPDISSDCLDV